MSDPATKEFWEDRYAASGQIWSGRPNAALVAVVDGLPAGTALDLGCGEGGDALWLAERGWRVTAVDVAPTALRRLADRAGDLPITTEEHDLAVSFPEGAWDLVSAQFLQSPIDFPRDAVLDRAARAVAPGGLLLVVAHASAPPWAWSGENAGTPPAHGHGHGHGHADFPTADETLARLREGACRDEAEWTVERAGEVDRVATGPSGETATIADSVLALRRRT